MQGDGGLIFIGLVFAAVFLLAQGLVVPVFGESRVMAKRLKQRLRQIDKNEDQTITSLLREKSLKKLSPFERRLESLPWMESLSARIAQSGNDMLAYRLVLRSFFLMIAAGVVTWQLWRYAGVQEAGGYTTAVLEWEIHWFVRIAALGAALLWLATLVEIVAVVARLDRQVSAGPLTPGGGLREGSAP